MGKYGYRICEYCAKVCRSEAGLDSHLRNKHQKTTVEMVEEVTARREPMEDTIQVHANGGSYIGIVFTLQGKRTDEYSDDELWIQCKQAAADKMTFPYTIELPCGAIQHIKNGWMLVNLPNENMPCPCGSPRHWIISFRDLR